MNKKFIPVYVYILFNAVLFVIEPYLSLAAAILTLAVLLPFHSIRAGILFAVFFMFIFHRYELLIFVPQSIFATVYPLYIVPIFWVYAVWAFRKMARIDTANTGSYLNKPAVFLILWSAVTLFWTQALTHGVNLVVTMIMNLTIVHLFIVYMGSKEDARRMVRFLIFLGILIGAMTFAAKFYILEYIYNISDELRLMVKYGGEQETHFYQAGWHYVTRTLKEQETQGVIRAGGFMSSESTAFTLNFIAFLVLTYLFGAVKKGRKYWLALLTFFFFSATVLTGSKGGFLSLLVGLAFVLAFNPALKGRRIRWSVFIALIFVSAIAFDFFVFSEDRIIGFLVKGSKGSIKVATGSYSSRMEIWVKGAYAFFATIGVGLGAGTSAMVAEKLPHMHSYYLSALYDLGLVGFLIFSGIVLKIFWELLKNLISSGDAGLKNSCVNIFAMFLASSVNGVTSNEYNSTLYWVVIGFVVAFTCLYSRPLVREAAGQATLEPATEKP